MTKEDVVRKITSRKFWVAIAGLVAGLILLFGGEVADSERWQGVVLTLGSIIAYALGEGWADSQRSNSEVLEIPILTEPPDEDQG